MHELHVNRNIFDQFIKLNIFFLIWLHFFSHKMFHRKTFKVSYFPNSMMNNCSPNCLHRAKCDLFRDNLIRIIITHH